MIAYYGPYSARLGNAVYLGQDAVVVPVPPAPARLPDPLPQGPQPAPVAVPPPAPKSPATVSIGGRQVSIVSLAVAGAITLGAIALVMSTPTPKEKKG